AKMRYTRFLPLTVVSCLAWVSVLSGAGYFFHSIITNFIGDFHRLGKFLLVIVVLGVGAFYLAERYWLSPKVEEADPERVHELEHAAEEKLKEIGEEIREHLPAPLARRPKEQPKTKRRAAGKDGD
ncbi:MAG: hypothetical protein LC774_03065, partial [Acidobacteria bacterium]|nr:hypothetical protein [Acidobacteriota bacterium]